MSKQASGGKRAVEKKHAERDAERTRAVHGENHRELWLAEVAELGAPPTDPNAAHEWLARASICIVRATLRDVAIPPEQMRRDAMRQIEQASKVLDPAKLAAQLDELERALDELRLQAARGSHAANV